jgi:hypothetical protein
MLSPHFFGKRGSQIRSLMSMLIEWAVRKCRNESDRTGKSRSRSVFMQYEPSSIFFWGGKALGSS